MKEIGFERLEQGEHPKMEEGPCAEIIRPRPLRLNVGN